MSIPPSISSSTLKKPMSKAKKVIIGAIIGTFLLCVIIGMISNSTPSGKATATARAALTLAAIPTETPVPTNTLIPPPTNTLEPKAELRYNIETALGAGNRNVPILTALNFDDPETGAIFIQWAINDNLSQNLIIVGAQTDATAILKAVAQSGIQYTYILMSGSFPMVDNFGNSKEANVVNLTFYPATVAKINWENFQYPNIYSIADEANVWVQFQK